MEITQSVGIVGTDRVAANLLGGIFLSNGYEVWTTERRNLKKELKKRKRTCRVVVFDVENEEAYRKEIKKRHALIGDVRAIEPRIETICVVHEDLCAGQTCKMRCAKVTCKNKSLSRLRSEIERVLRNVDLKCW